MAPSRGGRNPEQSDGAKFTSVALRTSAALRITAPRNPDVPYRSGGAVMSDASRAARSLARRQIAPRVLRECGRRGGAKTNCAKFPPQGTRKHTTQSTERQGQCGAKPKERQAPLRRKVTRNYSTPWWMVNATAVRNGQAPPSRKGAKTAPSHPELLTSPST